MLMFILQVARVFLLTNLKSNEVPVMTVKVSHHGIILQGLQRSYVGEGTLGEHNIRHERTGLVFCLHFLRQF